MEHEFISDKERDITLKIEEKVAIFWVNLWIFFLKIQKKKKDNDDSWWNGKNLNTGQVGWFPPQMVRVVNEVYHHPSMI